MMMQMAELAEVGVYGKGPGSAFCFGPMPYINESWGTMRVLLATSGALDREQRGKLCSLCTGGPVRIG